MDNSNWHKVHFIDETPTTASGTKVWVLNFLVGVTMLVVGFFGSRLINQVDDIDKSLQTTREVQAAQTEVIKGLQRDLDKNGQDIEKLKNDVDRLKEINAELKAKLKVSSTLDTSKVADGGLFLFLISKPAPRLSGLSPGFYSGRRQSIPDAQ
ncbi:TPA: hypothetical protein L8R51_004150 [Klebsiella pneumoniae]|uniref:hypothetical protein n=2 Tax=Klebsiella pneumoniae TaxID=573 RepID=UPI0015F33972|nr:hypothetical protein [Klebsiella pneumoniae]HDK6690503.1 hypothetical protein [Klebsiella quasipneumoniae]HBQ7269830.1 hypothetical protein [Klebsiella pneumoniae]HBQ7720418.1 hypothetical protein [Klebsiella pneumoniae]HBQ7741245.1 hypothetical protein [Klebsiella pneumoniae]HBV1818161.1 hypothetical protein [Klebsiella pneumoniae]